MKNCCSCKGSKCFHLRAQGHIYHAYSFNNNSILFFFSLSLSWNKFSKSYSQTSFLFQNLLNENRLKTSKQNGFQTFQNPMLCCFKKLPSIKIWLQLYWISPEISYRNFCIHSSSRSCIQQFLKKRFVVKLLENFRLLMRVFPSCRTFSKEGLML